MLVNIIVGVVCLIVGVIGTILVINKIWLDGLRNMF